MHANIVSDRSPLSSLLRIFLLVIIVGWFFVGQVLGLLAGSLIYDGNILEAIGDSVNHPDVRNAILLMQGLGSAIGLIFVPWYYLKISEGRGIGPFFKDERQWPSVTAAILLTVVGFAIAISPVVEWNAMIEFPEWMGAFGRWAKETEATAEVIIKTITSNLTPLTFLFTFVVVAIIPAIGEELVFRGLIQTEVQRAVKNPHVAILITAAMFSAFHFQFLGFFPRMLIGGILGYLYFWSGNLWVPILGHLVNNGLQVIGLYLNQLGIMSLDLDSTESAPLSMVGAAIVVTCILLFYLKRYFASRSQLPSDPA
jgi:membrane protease YdiL (CAAX protease family)